LRSTAVSFTGFAQWKSSIVMEKYEKGFRAIAGTPPKPIAATLNPKDFVKVRLFINPSSCKSCLNS